MNVRDAKLPTCPEANRLYTKRAEYLAHVAGCPVCQERAKMLTEIARSAVMPEFKE